jgi:hypothetical protein
MLLSATATVPVDNRKLPGWFLPTPLPVNRILEAVVSTVNVAPVTADAACASAIWALSPFGASEQEAITMPVSKIVVKSVDFILIVLEVQSKYRDNLIINV